jgi:hypothetical protein
MIGNDLKGGTLIGRWLLGTAALLLVAAPLPAQADLLWEWSYSGDGIAASGNLTTNTTLDSDGFYEITGITGTRNGVAITALEPTGEAIPLNEPYAVDNLIDLTGLLTDNGFGFELADGTYANPYYSAGYVEVYTQPASSGFFEVPITFSAEQIPEPATATLLLAGIAGLASLRLRRARVAA